MDSLTLSIISHNLYSFKSGFFYFRFRLFSLALSYFINKDEINHLYLKIGTIFVFILISCSKDIEEPVLFTLTVTANPTEGGTVSPTNGQYESGDVATVTATPNAEYVFEKWTGGATGTSSSVSVTMNGNKSVVANFIQKMKDANREDKIYQPGRYGKEETKVKKELYSNLVVSKKKTTPPPQKMDSYVLTSDWDG